MPPERLTIRDDVEVIVRPTTPSDHAELFARFAELVAADEGYPQVPGEPLSFDDFEAYWLLPAHTTEVARQVDDHELVAAYTMKPNGIGRAAHVANAGYFVVPSRRGLGLGEALVIRSMEVARRAGFDALQFNYVFEDNPARRLYERLGFEVVGRVPDVIDGQAVYIYWRKL